MVKKLTSIIYCKAKEKVSVARAQFLEIPLINIGGLEDWMPWMTFKPHIHLYVHRTFMDYQLHAIGSLTLRSSFNQELQNYKQKSQQFWYTVVDQSESSIEEWKQHYTNDLVESPSHFSIFLSKLTLPQCNLQHTATQEHLFSISSFLKTMLKGNCKNDLSYYGCTDWEK